MSSSGKIEKPEGSETPKPPGLENWVKAILAAIIATTSIQLATNPPGGVVQASLRGVAFLIFNTISFIASLLVILLILSGIPHKCKKFPKWLLPTAIGIAVTSLALTYLFATSMVTKTSIWASVVGIGFGVVLVVLVTLAIVWCCCSGCSGSDPAGAAPANQQVTGEQQAK